MNAKSKSTALVAAAVLVAVAIAFLAGRWTGGSESDAQRADESREDIAAGGQVETIWTCSMHPQVRQPNSGQCPICGMDLIPVAADEDSADETDLPRLRVSERSAALMNIQTWPAQEMAVEIRKPLLGIVRYDETRTYDVVVRTDSYIERIFTNYMGAPVREGDHLAELYSPDIFAAAEDLLIAGRMGGDTGEGPLPNARQRLRLLGVADREIDRILETGKAPRTFTVFSPHDGIINEMGGHQGHWLSAGEHLVEIVDTSAMWIWLDVYERDIPFIRYGQPVRFTVKSLPGREFTGSVAFVPPNIDRKARAFRVRLNVPNPDGALRDGMFVGAVLDAAVDARGRGVPPDMEGKWISPMHPEIVKDGPGVCDVCGMDLVPAEQLGLVMGDHELPLVIPAGAPLITGRRAVVYVKIPDADRPTFELRLVELGPRAGDYYIVYSGIEAGDQVVTHGNFKIDSELQLRGRPSMMAPGEAEPASEGVPDVDYMESPGIAEFAAEVPAEFGVELRPLLQGYLDMATGLAADDYDAAREGLLDLHNRLLEIGQHRLDGDAHVAWMEHYERLHVLSHRIEAAEDLDGMRAHLQQITREMEEIAVSFGAGELPALHRLYCPMAHGDHGATWLQDHETVDNPYFGAVMLRCGEVLGELP